MYYTIHDHLRKKYYDELSNLTTHLRQSSLFKYYTEEIPIHIYKSDLIAGYFGYENNLLPVTDFKTFSNINIVSDEEKKIQQFFLEKHAIDIKFEPAHTCINYGEILSNGLIFYLEKIEKKLVNDPNNDFYIAMRESIFSAINFAKRYAILADELASKSNDQDDINRLLRIRDALNNVPKYGARNFFEAVQSLWLLHQMIPMAETFWYSISLGRLDQFLYPFYLKSIENGESRDFIKEILKNFFILLDSYGDGACALNLGGEDANGNHMYNELSLLLIEVEKECALRAPIIAARISPNTPDEIFDKLIDFDLFRIGQPTFYGEYPCREAVLKRGVSIEESITFTANSCMGLILAGSEFANMWGTKFNTHLPLEMALNGGKPLHNELGYVTRVKQSKVTTEEELLNEYEKYLKEILGVSANISYSMAKNASVNSSDPFLSIFIDGCIDSGLDRAIGAKYNTVTIECMGFINTCDAIEAICSLVFDSKKYTIEQILEAVKLNFMGYDQLLYDLKNCKKYGMNDERSNRIVAKVGSMISDVCRQNSRENYIFVPSLHTIDDNVWFGSRLHATIDGRLAGEPVNKNANPTTLAKNITPTSVVLSATCVPQVDFSGGQPIDLFFFKSYFNSNESKEKIKALIKTYFELGGLQIQVNSLDVELLEKAYENPEQYKNLIIRKGGFSTYFVELSPKVQRDFIEQAKQSGQI